MAVEGLGQQGAQLGAGEALIGPERPVSGALEHVVNAKSVDFQGIGGGTRVRNTLRLEFGGCWYIDLEQALSEEYRTAFTALLAALPPDVPLFSGRGQGPGSGPPARWRR